ncbi:hypothetical protein [Pantanalinema sp. GBBB05]|uniref:hypothetical protein n=1 Tax=Pantanalinema sp. GBBB05 TaxID=2604139 RepID=UPI001E07BBD3|nr:hypothetical protein [Pantanalinema sp. GBBB05]
MGLLSEQQPHPTFQSCQIVCLEHEANRLYAEVVQVAEPRQVCWVRPLILVLQPSDELGWYDGISQATRLYNLRGEVDLLLPVTLFRAALDEEVIPVLPYLYAEETSELALKLERVEPTQLRQLVQTICQAHPEAF